MKTYRFILCLFLTIFFRLLPKETIDPKLVDIQEINPTIAVDLFLADPKNFLGAQLYPSSAKAYIDYDIALRLDQIQNELRSLGLGLKIKDAYRPLAVQKRLWEIALTMDLDDPGDYVSDPVIEGGRHPRGIAVDVTLVNLVDGKELPMPPFGFIKEAHHGYFENLNQEQINNREFLKNIMTRHGFVSISCEWWHYNLPNWQDYTPLDVSLLELDSCIE